MKILFQTVSAILFCVIPENRGPVEDFNCRIFSAHYPLTVNWKIFVKIGETAIQVEVFDLDKGLPRKVSEDSLIIERNGGMVAGQSKNLRLVKTPEGLIIEEKGKKFGRLNKLLECVEEKELNWAQNGDKLRTFRNQFLKSKPLDYQIIEIVDEQFANSEIYEKAANLEGQKFDLEFITLRREIEKATSEKIVE